MPPNLTPEQQLVQRWLRKSLSDLSSAQWLLERKPPPLDTACFHCQQAIEKALKAVLAIHGVAPPRTHSLKLLFGLCIPLATPLQTHQMDCEWVEIYGVETRYPDSPAEPNEADTRLALSAAERLFATVLTVVPREVHP